MRVASNGFVGIGTTTPGALLDVSSSTSNSKIRMTAPNAIVEVQDPGNAAPLSLYSSTSAQGLYTTAAKIQISTNGLTGNNGIIVSNNFVGIGTTAPVYTFDVSGTAALGNQGFLFVANAALPGATNYRTYFGGWSGLAAADIGRLFVGDGTGWKFHFSKRTASVTTDLITFADSGRIGVGTTVPTARLDVSEADTLASVNMSTWSRASLSNAVIVRGYFIPLVGNTINWSNAGNSPNTALITWTPSNATLGGHFIIKKSGIWGITYRVTGSPAGTHYTWIDASSNNVANVPFNTAGSPIMAFSQGTISVLHVSYTGYLHAQTGTFYKVRYASGSLTTPVTLSHFQISLLYETPDLGTNFPFS